MPAIWFRLAAARDPSKPEVGIAMTYFATQTRRQEVLEQQLTEADKRVEIRLRVMATNRRLAEPQRELASSVTPFFNLLAIAASTEDLSEVKARKGLALTDELLDHAGPSSFQRMNSRPT